MFIDLLFFLFFLLIFPFSLLMKSLMPCTLLRLLYTLCGMQWVSTEPMKWNRLYALSLWFFQKLNPNLFTFSTVFLVSNGQSAFCKPDMFLVFNKFWSKYQKHLLINFYAIWASLKFKAYLTIYPGALILIHFTFTSRNVREGLTSPYITSPLVLCHTHTHAHTYRHTGSSSTHLSFDLTSVLGHDQAAQSAYISSRKFSKQSAKHKVYQEQTRRASFPFA